MVARIVVAIVVAGLVAIPTESESFFTAGAKQGHTLLQIHEAEILIYLLPEAHAIRNEGMEVGWELQTGHGWNQDDYFSFWVVNPKRQNVGSVTVGHYAVNKYTADVWDLALDHRIENPELQGVQEILRRAHQISADKIQKYRSRPLR